MSEQIKITVVMDDEKQNTVEREQKPKRILLTQGPFMTLMSVLQENRLLTDGLCGGRGECGRCAVQFLDGAPMPSALDRKRFSAKELRQGYRLACIARPRTDCVIRLLQNEAPKPPILTKTIPLSENIDLNSQEKKRTENQTSGATELSKEQIDGAENGIKRATVIAESQPHVTKCDENAVKRAAGILKSQSDVTESNAAEYMIAVDLGTTTIAMQLIPMASGEAVDTYCEHNPQRSYGADVISRIQASCTGHREELQRLVCETLLRGLRRFLSYLSMRCEDAGRLRCICIAGNTAMEHLLLGYDVHSLGRSPFIPVEIGVQETTLASLFACLNQTAAVSARGLAAKEASAIVSDSAAERKIWEDEGLRCLPVYLTPGISTFVGGDVAAGLYAMHMLPGFGDAGGVHFLVDLGTNGEMAITDGKRVLATATAAGPAFEGGGESALIGTDRIALTASFLRRGILDETGLLAEPYFSEGVPVEPGHSHIAAGTVRSRMTAGQPRSGAGAGAEQGTSCRMKKEDIRALQMAKAAIRAGIEILWQEMGCPRVDMVYLAGGFGYELDVEAAFTIGLLPVRLRGRVQAVGNTSLAGAFLLGRALWEGRIDRSALAGTLSSGSVVESINLAKRKSFAALYLQYMNLEEN